MRSFEPGPDDGRSPYQRMIDGDWYIASDPAIHREYRAAQAVAGQFAQEYPADPDGAQALLRPLLGSLGEKAHVRAPLFVDYGPRLHIGPGTFVNFNLTALDVVEIRIGANCQLGPGIQLLTPMHPLEAGPRRDGWEAAAPITIGDNVWIGGGAIVGPGVRIGDDSVIGAGSVVTRDVPAGTLALGSPARVLREL